MAMNVRMVVSRLTTQAQRPGTQDALIANHGVMPGSLQRMVSCSFVVHLSKTPGTSHLEDHECGFSAQCKPWANWEAPAKALPKQRQRLAKTNPWHLHGS